MLKDDVPRILARADERPAGERGRKTPSRPTPATTIEAMLYSLRRGLSCLSDPSCRERLMRCDADAMQHVAAESVTWKLHSGDWLPAWSDEDVAALVKAWRTMRKGR